MKSMQVRNGETTTQNYARKERFFQENGYWYYATREGVNIGPFDARNDAEDGCMEFIDFVQGASPKFSETLMMYRCA